MARARDRAVPKRTVVAGVSQARQRRPVIRFVPGLVELMTFSIGCRSSALREKTVFQRPARRRAPPKRSRAAPRLLHRLRARAAPQPLLALESRPKGAVGGSSSP